jgi:hypothetical protein
MIDFVSQFARLGCGSYELPRATVNADKASVLSTTAQQTESSERCKL